MEWSAMVEMQSRDFHQHYDTSTAHAQEPGLCINLMADVRKAVEMQSIALLQPSFMSATL